MIQKTMFAILALSTLAVAPCYADCPNCTVTANSLTTNLLTANALSFNALASNALTSTVTSKQGTIGQLGQVIAVELPRH